MKIVSRTGHFISISLTFIEVFITGLLYWSMVENGLGLLAACLPLLRVLLRDFTSPILESLKNLLTQSHLPLSRAKTQDQITGRLQSAQGSTFAGSKTSNSFIGESSCEDIEAYEFDRRTSEL